ncbi:MAG: hypothetical protein KAU58_05530, partial [Candidatus Omnitrophica bacterium]|nr:hypothetical protein [Candidatus Omnitrophota bacterium]
MRIKTRRYYIYYVARVCIFLIYLLPIRFASKLADLLGKLGYDVLEKAKREALGNLRAAFKDKSDKEIRKIAKGAFSNVARSIAEYINISKINKKNIDSWVRPHGLEKVDKALALGKGAIVLTAHLGNWEFVGAYLRARGYEGAVIARRIYFYKYNDYLISLRSIHDVTTLYRDRSPKEALRLLRENKILGMLADQDIDSIDGIFVNFFGRQTYTPTAPVKIAMVNGTPMIPCYMIRKKDKYDF